MFTYKTSVGPHRDDLEFKINGISAKNFGSQGQKRSVALSLKLAEAEILKKTTGEYPICLLDDIMSELDIKRRMYLSEQIRDKQVLITSTDIDINADATDTRLFKIDKGAVINVS